METSIPMAFAYDVTNSGRPTDCDLDMFDAAAVDLEDSEFQRQFDAKFPRKATPVIFRMFGPFFGR